MWHRPCQQSDTLLRWKRYSILQLRPTTNAKKNIHPFIFKAGVSINDHTNENGPNSKLKALYNTSKAKCMVKYGTSGFQPQHMNSILVETWEAFMVSDGKIIRERLAKTQLPPLSPPNTKTNTQECVASIKTSSKCIN